jgi:predicted phage baseplate assembly protein
VPPDGATILVAGDLTAADGGDVRAGAISAVPGEPVAVRNVVAAAGGRAAETVAGAVAAVTGGRAPDRAVTLADHVALALATPGTRLARAEAFANRHPAFDCLTASGVVTVVILPSLPLRRPMPEAGLCRAVAAHLAPRRVVGTRIEVVGPTYTTVSVRATVAAAPGDRAAGLADAVRTAVEAFFDPITGGPDGTGWPFGRHVYRAEVLSLIDRVPGVAHVLALALVAGEETCGDICIGPTGLIANGPHEIAVR